MRAANGTLEFVAGVSVLDVTAAVHRRSRNGVTAMKSELGRKGTHLWAFKRYSEGLLQRLLDDLIAAEKNGVTDEQCGAIHRSL